MYRHAIPRGKYRDTDQDYEAPESRISYTAKL